MICVEGVGVDFIVKLDKKQSLGVGIIYIVCIIVLELILKVSIFDY